MWRKWSLWVVLSLLLVVAGLGIWFRPQITREVILPIAQFLWVLYRVVASVDQAVYWLVLIVAVFVMASRILFAGRRHGRQAEAVHFEAPVSREQYWTEAISNAIDNQRSLRHLRGQLGQLLVSSLHRPNRSDNVAEVLSGLRPPLPPGLRCLYLEAPSGQRRASFRARVSDLVRLVLQLAWWQRRNRVEGAYREIEEIIHSIEDYMEIGHEIRPGE